MQSRIRRMAAAFAVLLLLASAAPSVFARGSFGRSGGSFGGGGRSFGGGGLFGGSRPSFTPAPRPFFTPAPRPSFAPAPAAVPAPAFSPAPALAPRPSFGARGTPVVAASPGSFGRAGGVGSPVSNRFEGSTGGGGSFGRSGTAGARTFTSVGRHDPPPAPVVNQGRPLTSAYDHPYSYGGRPASAFFTGGYRDYSFGYYRHPYYAWSPWSPVFYYNPPIYVGGGYVSGGFSFIRFLVGIVFWVAVIAVVVAVVNHFRSRQSA